MPGSSLASSPPESAVLKLSGACFADEEAVEYITGEIIGCRDLGVGLSVVVGGGNFLRGRDATLSLPRVQADAIGMLGTIINGIRLAARLSSLGVPCAHLSGIGIPGVVEAFVTSSGLKALAQGKVLILSGGTGHPFFSTDTAAALRGCQLSARVILKGTRVDGIYDADPERNPSARRYSFLTFKEVLEKGLSVMDQAAFSLCREEGLPIVVFNIHQPGNLRRVLLGEEVGTRVEG